MTKVEQIYNNRILNDYDEVISRNEISQILETDLKVVNKSNPYSCIINDIEIQLFVKQITYLGNPHKLFKKRIQISRGWQEQLKEKNSFLIGIYKYRNTVIYCNFDKTNFLQRITNNSSAHVSTFDLLKANEDGIFEKKDSRNNIITTIRRDRIKEFLEQKIENKDTLSPEINLFENFKNSIPKRNHGICCYKEMIMENYRNKFQPEWAGFFLEFKFENFIANIPNYKKICSFQSNKKRHDIDLDLNFNNSFYGDLKSHTNGTGGILGNDQKNIEFALEKFSKIWYVVFNHDTEKDSKYKYEVTHFWNKSQNKSNLMSYSNKMKNNITFTDFLILEINNYNKKYLSVFKQGKNSNQRNREPKIKINKTEIDNFLIYQSKF